MNVVPSLNNPECNIIRNLIPGGNETFYTNVSKNTVHISVLIIVYSTLFLLGIFGNLLVIVIILKRQLKLKNDHIPTIKLWIMNLAVADLFSLLFCIPYHLITEIYDNFVFGKNFFGTMACKIPPSIYYTCDWVSILTVFVMALSRFIVLICPLRKWKKFVERWKENLILIVFVWLVGCLISFPNFLNLKLESICDLLEKTMFYPTLHGSEKHVHWDDLGKAPCDETYEFENGYENIRSWLDDTISSDDPHRNEPAYFMLSTLLQCWSLNDLLTCAWENENSKVNYQTTLLSIWFSITYDTEERT